MKTLILSVFLMLFIAIVGYAIPRDRNVIVDNAIVPLNSNLASQLSATIAFSTDTETINNNSSASLAVTMDSQGIIVVSAPRCGQYAGYHCWFPIPDYCLRRIQTAGKLFISGVMSEYGLDYYSFRCSFTSEE